MASPQSWLRKAEDIVLWAVALCSILILVADIILPESWKHLVAEQAPVLTLLLLSLFVLAYLRHTRLRSRLDNALRLGVKEIYLSRYDEEQIKAYRELLNGAERELFIVGVTLRDLSREQSQHICDRIKQGCNVDLLMLSPRFWENKDPILDPVAHALGAFALKSNFYTSIVNIRLLAKQIRSGRYGGKFTVRFYSNVPTVSLTVQDGETARARMHVEVLPHQVPVSPFRPIMNIEKTGDDGLFKEFYDRYRQLWDDSEIYIEVCREFNSGMKVARNLDAEICTLLALPANWEDDSLGKAAKP